MDPYRHRSRSGDNREGWHTDGRWEQDRSDYPPDIEGRTDDHARSKTKPSDQRYHNRYDEASVPRPELPRERTSSYGDPSFPRPRPNSSGDSRYLRPDSADATRHLPSRSPSSRYTTAPNSRVPSTHSSPRGSDQSAQQGSAGYNVPEGMQIIRIQRPKVPPTSIDVHGRREYPDDGVREIWCLRPKSRYDSPSELLATSSRAYQTLSEQGKEEWRSACSCVDTEIEGRCSMIHDTIDPNTQVSTHEILKSDTKFYAICAMSADDPRVVGLKKNNVLDRSRDTVQQLKRRYSYYTEDLGKEWSKMRLQSGSARLEEEGNLERLMIQFSERLEDDKNLRANLKSAVDVHEAGLLWLDKYVPVGHENDELIQNAKNRFEHAQEKMELGTDELRGKLENARSSLSEYRTSLSWFPKEHEDLYSERDRARSIVRA
ncbi:uncharacterized protein IL334_000711 [Kwoniella shivajii]|uniref:Uncharacterized protein n=1 Tax=Kwoniella shivajii TaxID=564305 RepID=A0ABZ1CSY0_9TREE|nr:hypothetical protein IL334_000711 [Kwoniella shivajii]